MLDKISLVALLEAVKIAREGKISDHVRALVEKMKKKELKEKKQQ